MRYKNGYVDDGSSINKSKAKCPNCGSSKYKETLSLESCTACGLRCDYWGGGANDVYDQYLNRRDRQEEDARYESIYMNGENDEYC